MDQKIINFLTWFCGAKERYNLPVSMLERFGLDPVELLKSKEKRAKFVNEILPMVVMAADETKVLTMVVRGFYEDMGPEERAKFVSEGLLPLAQDWARRSQEVATFIETHQNDVAQDLRLLGAYLTMFTPYLKKKDLPKPEVQEEK